MTPGNLNYISMVLYEVATDIVKTVTNMFVFDIFIANVKIIIVLWEE